jgi:N-acetylglucosaminyl-diphospho-decaprenol L-rhamnosyltransferase
VSQTKLNDVAIIIVGWNACKYVRDCIESIHRARWDRTTFKIIYVDNGSADGSVEMAQSEFPDVRVIANDRNLGFCRAANQGALVASSRYLFFLNDDTIVGPDAIQLLVDFMEAHPEGGVVGARLLNPDLTDQWSGRRFPSALNGVLGRRSRLSRLMPNAKVLSDYLYRDLIRKGDPFEADWVSAAALLVDNDTFVAVNGFAEDYYYWHEAVFCDRVRREGRRVFLEPRSEIIHFEGKGSGARPYRIRRWHIIDFHRGAYRCYCEHYGCGILNPVRWLTAAALGIRATALLLAARLMSQDD